LCRAASREITLSSMAVPSSSPSSGMTWKMDPARGGGFGQRSRFHGAMRWNRERAGRGFRGDCRHGMEWPELAGIWPTMEVEGGGRGEEEGGALRWGSASWARVSGFVWSTGEITRAKEFWPLDKGIWTVVACSVG
jgi:hypothetical protein